MASNSDKPRRVAFKLDLKWPYKHHTAIFAGAQQYAEEQGWESTIDDFVADRLPATRTEAVPYDGVIGRATQKLMERASHLAIPVVNIWVSSPVWQDIPGVFADGATAGRLQAEHLLARGIRRFAILGNNDRTAKIHAEAFQSIVREAGFPCVITNWKSLPDTDFTSWQKFEERIKRAMRDWQLPIGVFARQEVVGRLVAQMCRQKGWRVPHDVAIICGSNEEAICELPRPSLTSVEYGYERIGYEAARLLDQLMDGHPPPTKPTLLPPKAVVVRESTDFHAVDAPLIAAALAYIASNSNRPIGAEDVALGVETGLRTLQRNFREYLGRPIGAEIQRARLECAKRELSESERPIKDIARDVGFGRAMRMYEVFRRELGVTPREYRKQRQIEVEV
jgi:LacI family transcriptional regulator